MQLQIYKMMSKHQYPLSQAEVKCTDKQCSRPETAFNLSI